ncbi:MAG: Glu-tRNA(Gln) amidotransferase subunit GatE [Candidatus Lokiarchaeota archaeon]|nr:Glu-tRNA(Gln) amidotransferase subunit GatE [Candidatus Lokiarchaeota archaeon]
MYDFDYDELGMKCGLEIHQQLNTKKKLFCRCPSKLLGKKESDFTIKRLMRPVLGEMGTFDKAMLTEYEKNINIEYECYNDEICTYELDETPPFSCNNEARKIALKIALLLNSNIIEEMHVCRKNYLDGSVPSGFQRTMILGTDGFVTLKTGKKVRIEILSLEEDSARKIKTINKTNYFRLDRLGIPLVEITTKPDINNPEECRECAERLGLLLWSTNVKKVLGSIRQDINVSIKKGTRIEIKGVQKLEWIPILINHEISRQIGLLNVKEELERRKLTERDVHDKHSDLTEIFSNESSNLASKEISSGKKLYGINLKGFKDIFGKLLIKDYRFGTEVSSKVKSLTGLNGIIHSDEDLKKYNFSESDVKKIKNNLNSKEEDCFVLVLGTEEKVSKAITTVVERVKQAFKGVPPETRKALENGNTEFLRELHGGARLYPDTDSRAIMNDIKEINEIKGNLPDYPWNVIKEYAKSYHIEESSVKQLFFTGKLNLFKKLIKIYPDNPSIIINKILNTTTALRREGKDVGNIKESDFEEIFMYLKNKEISKEAIEEIMIMKADHPELTIIEIKERLKLESISLEELSKIIDDVIDNNIEIVKQKGMRAIGPLMGEVMKKVRGKIDGAIISREMKNKLSLKLKELK